MSLSHHCLSRFQLTIVLWALVGARMSYSVRQGCQIVKSLPTILVGVALVVQLFCMSFHSMKACIVPLAAVLMGMLQSIQASSFSSQTICDFVRWAQIKIFNYPMKWCHEKYSGSKQLSHFMTFVGHHRYFSSCPCSYSVLLHVRSTLVVRYYNTSKYPASY
jgi:hypothetical protein